MENEAGTKLAKVLWYYNLADSSSLVQKIVCPFHEDVNPSLIANMEDGSWFCFGCNLAGDAQRFVKFMEAKYHGKNDLQAYHKYIQILKSDKCSGIKIGVRQKAKKQPQKELYAEAYDYYHGLRKVNWSDSDESEVVEAREYMASRGFSPSTLSKCGAKVTYNNSYGIIFPIMDNGKFKGWVCRTTIKSIEQKRKYLYNTGFSRAFTVVGDYGKYDYVFVVEGYMDRLKFIQHGVNNVVAIFGWKMSQGQFDKLKAAGIKTVISALDNDECGRKGTRYLQQIWGKSNVIRFRYLKGIKDPGETTKEQFGKMYGKTMHLHRKNRYTKE